MQRNKTNEIPLEVQLKAICSPKARQVYTVLKPFVPTLRKWLPILEPHERFQARVKKHLDFTTGELISYLKDHPEICKTLVDDSYDKRYAPTAFIEEMNDGNYRVGWVSYKGNPLTTQIHVFATLWVGTADYVLLSWGFPRFKEKSFWVETDHY